MLQIMFREFYLELSALAVYAVVVVIVRATSFVPILLCTYLNQCEFLYAYDQTGTAVVLTWRVAGVLYYYIMSRGAIRLCDPR